MPTIRSTRLDDLAFMWDMLWEAAAVSEEVRALGREAGLALPDISRYLEGWGRPGDIGVIAIDDGERPCGAAWARRFSAESPGYGFVAPDIPELAIGVDAAYRGQGIGSALIDALAAIAQAQGHRGLSLSVDRRNPALALYRRKGFQDTGTSDPEDGGITMLKLF